MREGLSRRRFLTGALASGVGTKLAAGHATSERSALIDGKTAGAEPSRSQPTYDAGHWWEQEPLRGLDTEDCYSGSPSSSPSPALDASGKTTLAFNVEHLAVMGMAGGLDDQEFFFSSQLAGKKNEDYLARYLPEAKKRGLQSIIYFNVHWFKNSFADRHPDWRQILEGGGTVSEMYGQPSTTFCINNPGFREWVFQIVRELCAYPIQGIFYDGPVFFPSTCYCRFCQEKYQKQYGGKLPSKKQRKGKPARDLLEFQSSSLADFLRDSRRIIKSINPELVFYVNGGVRGGNWSSARQNRVLIAEQDLLGSEGGYFDGDMTRIPVWKPGVTARLLEAQSPDKPRVIFSTCRPAPWQYSQHPEAELRLIYAGTVANASSPLFEVWKSFFPRPEIQALNEMNRFVANNGAYFLGTRSEATTALVWSDTTANFYDGADAQLLESEQAKARSEIGNLDGEFAGLADAILRSQTPFDVIDDVSLERERLNRYAAIFLPNVACMSEKTVACLKKYVQQGGNLFATFETSLYDDTGIRRADFALAEVFGVTDARKIVGPMRSDSMQPRATSPLLQGWARDLVPATTYHVLVKPKGGEALVYFMKPVAGTLAGLPKPSDDPALVVHQYGEGKAIYFSGDIGNVFNSFHLIEWSRLIENVLRDVAPSPVVLEDAPRSVEVVLRSQQQCQRLLLHLINFTGEMTRPIRRVVPLENVRVSVRTNGEVKKAHTLMRPQVLMPRMVDGQRAEVVLPRIDEYEVVVLEK